MFHPLFSTRIITSLSYCFKEVLLVRIILQIVFMNEQSISEMVVVFNIVMMDLVQAKQGIIVLSEFVHHIYEIRITEIFFGKASVIANRTLVE